MKEQIEKIVNNANLNKSEKIRQLLKLGISKYKIAKLLKIRYQFVYNVEFNEKLKTGK